MAELVPVSQKFATIRDVLAKRQADIAAAIPRGIDAQRFTRVALSQFQIKPALLDCTPASVFTAIMQAAGWGLELDVMLGQAYLVPYKDRRAGVTLCQLQLGYRGMLALARRSGEIANFLPGIVHEKDTFEYKRAGRRHDGSLGTILEHLEYDGPDDPGPVVATYIAMISKEGHEQIDVMFRRDIDKSRARSRAKDEGPWVTDFDAMALKSVVRRASKFWPLETSVAAAINQDELIDLGVETPIVPALTEQAGPDGSEAATAPAEPSKLDQLASKAKAERDAEGRPEKAERDAAEREKKAESEAAAPPTVTPIARLDQAMTDDEYSARLAFLQGQIAAIMLHQAKPPEVTKDEATNVEPTDAELDAEIARKEAELEAERAKHVAAPSSQSTLSAEEQARKRAKDEQSKRHEPPRAHRGAAPPASPPASPLLAEREPGEEG